MQRIGAAVIAGVVFAGGLAGQGAAAPEFEVASIRPAPMQAPGRVSTRMSTDPGRLTYTNVSLSDVIAQAYGVQRIQISGPAWLAAERFDIFAKIPVGAGTERVPEMLQTLLAGRFGLKLHRETKDLPLYALAAGKNGPKLEKATSTSGLGGGSSAGRAHAEGRVSMATLAEYLAGRLGRPVVDRTGLEGAYAVKLEWSLETDGDAAGPSLFTALGEQLGLRLEAGKGPVEVLVIDRVERTPAAN